MGLEMELNFENKCSMDLSPNTVLPCRDRSNIERRKTKGNAGHRDDILRVKGGFTEISFLRYRSSLCKSIPSRLVGLEGNIELKRGSIYQSSGEVRKIKKMGNKEGRRKIELSRCSDTSLSFTVVDSLCSSDEEITQKRSSILSVNSNPTSVSKPYVVPRTLDRNFIEICPNFDKREKDSAEPVGVHSVEDRNFCCDHVVGPLNDGNDLHERDTALVLHKSHSTTLGMVHSPSQSESDCSSKASSKIRFSPIRKMFDPFVKSKSIRSPLGYVMEHGDVKTTSMENIRRNRTFRKSLFHDFSHTVQNSEFDVQSVKKDQHTSVVASSPVHLHACLKWENKHGVPFFKFSLSCPEEVFVAKTWKADNAFNWVYTFHSICSRKKSSAGGWGSNDCNKESSMVGQMQVSCYLCSELKNGGDFDNSMATEFVLYDLLRARRRTATQENSEFLRDVGKALNGSNCGLVVETLEVDNGYDAAKVKCQPKHASDSGNFGSSNNYPWASAVLHPSLEIAAIVLQGPFEKRESLKCKRGDTISDKAHSNLLNLSVANRGEKTFHDSRSSETVNVVIPSGNHSLPNNESWGPSSLLDRWRLGGGCDCGGWDMACPLIVFGNPGIQCGEDQPLMDDERPLELFVQGTKEKTLALAMKFIEEGQYVVDFHAQLSTLQAFSICVALLHDTVASSAGGKERRKPVPHCNSLKVLIDEDLKFLVEAVTDEEKMMKKKDTRMAEEIQPSYVLNPPFSPIARV